jgi:NADH-quinone oxidoreductase subunit L
MAFALIVLAAGSVFAGYAGLSGRFETYLEPSFAVRTADVAADSGLEWTLMGVSSVVALLGIGIAAYFFLKNRGAADAVAARFAGVHRVLEHKYYVDEIYSAAIVQPIRIVSDEALWKGVDVQVIDGTVNSVGRMVAGGGEMLRRLQTGSVRAYAASLFVGVVMILGYYLWR